jgi:hypothetical protein
MRGCGTTNGLGKLPPPEAVLFRIASSPHPRIPHASMLSSNARCSPRPLRLAAYIATSA